MARSAWFPPPARVRRSSSISRSSNRTHGSSSAATRLQPPNQARGTGKVPNSLSHVACVDDDVDILHVASLALETVGGLRVTTFEGPMRALDGLTQARPDLLLLDVMMPEMD